MSRRILDATPRDPTIQHSHGARRSRHALRGHRLPVPQLTINANFTIGKVTLSCDEGECGLSSMHADFRNTWDQAGLERLVVSHINDVPFRKPRLADCQTPPVPS